MELVAPVGHGSLGGVGQRAARCSKGMLARDLAGSIGATNSSGSVAPASNGGSTIDMQTLRGPGVVVLTCKREGGCAVASVVFADDVARDNPMACSA